MSFPFVQPYFGLGNSLQTAQASAAGGGVGGWVELARTTLGSAADDINVSSISDKRYYMVLTDFQDSGNTQPGIRLGNSSLDSGANYAERWSTNGGAELTVSSNTYHVQWVDVSGTTKPIFGVSYIANKSANEKLGISHVMNPNTAGAANAPDRQESVFKWTNTSNPLDILGYNNKGSGDFNTGSEVVVLGWDPADTHTTNFWEELGEITIGSAASSMTSSTFTAKKYLWVQGYIKPDGTDTITPTLQLGNGTIDTGNNYSTRYSYNGGSDGTITSNDTMEFLYNTGAKGEPIFFNTFIVNNASNEKLSITEVVAQEQAGNTSDPERSEGVGKWSNTSNQANILKIDQWSGTGNLGTDSIVKIWGSN